MSRIVIDAREYPTSTGRYIRKLLEYLEKIDTGEHEYHVLIKSADIEAYQPAKKNFHKIRADFKEFTFAEQIGLLKLINTLKPDLVHFGITHQPILYQKLKITTIHDLTTARFHNPAKNWLIFKIKQLVYIGVIKLVARSSQKIITISNFVKEDIVKFTNVNPEKIVLTYESADKIEAEPVKLKEVENKPFLLYVGRVQPHKNIKRLIDALQLLHQTKPDLKLVLVGKRDNLTEKLLQYAHKNNISGVIATGYVSEGELRWLYENCQAYLFASLSEGFGLPSLEAMKHGAPVVSSNATCLPEINGKAAHYFDPLNVKDMAEKISEVLDNQTLRDELINKGSSQVKRYSWQRMAKQTLAVYNDVINGR